jgi:hypothetical protein
VAVRVDIDPGVQQEEFDVEPAGAFGTSTELVWLPVPRDATIDSTRLTDLATGRFPAPQPWRDCSEENFGLVYEGRRPGDPDRYGIIFRITNISARTCNVSSLRWRYAVWYSRSS